MKELAKLNYFSKIIVKFSLLFILFGLCGNKSQLCKCFRHTVKYMFAYFFQFVLSGI